MSMSERYEALLPLMDRKIVAAVAMVENCHRAREAGEEPERRRDGRGGAAGAAILGAILRGIPFGEFGGAASGSQGSERFGQ